MNKKILPYILGRVIQIEALILLAPLIVAFIYNEGYLVYRAYGFGILITLGIGTLLSLHKPNDTHVFNQDGLAVVALIWLSYSLLGAVPLYLAKDIHRYVDAFFQMSSGFTTTGATAIDYVESMSYASKFWLALSHLIGGMGVLVFVLALLPGMGVDSVNIMKAEVPGPSFGKINSRTKDTALRLYLIYFGMTVILIIALLLAGMNLFDAITHAFSTAGTGGFGNYNDSIAHFDSTPIHLILAFGMLAFGVNFNLYHYILLYKGLGKNDSERMKSEEFRWYIGIITIVTAIITFSILGSYLKEGKNFGLALRDSFFTSTSIISTTGFSTVDFNLWPSITHVSLFFLMFAGGCAGSTGGGLKISRVAMLSKSAFHGIRSAFQPNRALPLRFEFKTVKEKELIKLFQYLVVYCMIFLITLLIVSLDGFTFGESFSAVSACINNIGPGIGVFGPKGSFAAASDLSKITLSLAMIAGRLELYPMLILFKLPGQLFRDIRTK